MATTINNIDQTIAWGVTPTWVSGQLNKQLKAGTGTGTGTGSYKDGWGSSHTYTYTYNYQIYGLDSIRPDGFNLSQWNSYDQGTKGSKANNTYTNNGGGYSLNANTNRLSITQNVGDVSYGTPIVTVSSKPATNSKGQTVSQTIDNTRGSTPITQTLTLQYDQTVASNASTTNGWSNTTEISIGASVSAEFAGIGAEVNSSVTNSTTIDSSKTTGTEESSTQTTSSSTQVTVDPGYKIQVVVNYTSQNISMPYTAPVTVTGSSQLTDMYGNSLAYNVGDAIDNAVKYGVINSAYAKGTSSTASPTIAKLLATGTISNINSTDFTITQYTLVAPQVSSTSSTKLSSLDPSKYYASTNTKAEAIVFPEFDDELALYKVRDGGKIKINGASKTIGLMYTAGEMDNGDIAIGSATNDYFTMDGPNQEVHTNGGSDFVNGSKYDDKVFSNGGNSGGDFINTADGNDLIVSNNSGDTINAGNGNDRVLISIDNGKSVDDVTLGNGKDILQLTFDAGVNKVGLVVRDLTLDDDLIISGAHSSLKAERQGSSIELIQLGKPVAVLENYASQFDSLTGKQTIELALNNMDCIYADSGSHKTVHEWREALLEQSALGSNMNKSYAELRKNKKEFNENIVGLSKYLFNKEVPGLTSWANANSGNYNSAFAFGAAFTTIAQKQFGLTPDLPSFAAL